MGRGRDKVDKLVQYIKDDRPKKFKSCVKKYKINVSRVSLPKGRTLLHYTANFGTGSLIDYLLEKGVDASKPNDIGDLPLHVAISRALDADSSEMSEVYFDVVTPLLEAYPLAVDVDNHRGDSGQELLKQLKQRLKRQSQESHAGGSRSHLSPDREWKDKLAQEFESESTDFFGRYHDCEDDFLQERQRETREEWKNRMWKEMDRHRHQQNYHGSTRPSDRRRKRQHAPHTSESDSHPSSAKRSALDEDELKRARAKMQEAYRLQQEREKRNQFKTRRTAYEANYQTVLSESSAKMLGFSDIPWPSQGSMQSVMDVLFNDLGIQCKVALKKYVRQQQVRWHPDKFLQKFRDRLEHADREKVLERVKQMSQAINNRAETLLVKDG